MIVDQFVRIDQIKYRKHGVTIYDTRAGEQLVESYLTGCATCR